MPRLNPDAGVAGHQIAIPSRRALLGLVAAFAGLVVGLTAATPGRADRQLIERTMELVTFGGCSDCGVTRISLHSIVYPY
jgi:hypothetical protein